MCGITGAIWIRPELAIRPDQLNRMTEALVHRGPDESGSWISDLRDRSPYPQQPGVALGFRRLSIIDLAQGSQPMSNEDGSVQVVFNGEIYNYRTLRRRLEGSGHKFRTDSDTETIVHLYEDEELGFLEHLNGMFGLAVWDARQRRLVLARDRLGQKPLIYRAEPGRLLFASELKSLLTLDLPRELDAAALDEYLTYQYVPHDKTIFRGFHKLSPGHCAVWQDDQLEIRPYWTPDLAEEATLTPESAVVQLQELLESSVRLRMQSDVPLGAFLSGGIDSSLVVALMQKLSAEPVKTFSIGFPVAEYDESTYAKRVATALGTEHFEFQVSPNAVEILPQLVWHYDEPFADSSALPTWYVSQLTREHVTVALSGDGSDELFAGYPRYRAVWLASLLDQMGPIRSLLAASVWKRLPGSRHKSILRRFKRFSEFLGQTPQRRYLQWIAIFHEQRRAELYTDSFLETLPDSDPFHFLRSAWSRSQGRDTVTNASLADLTTYLPCDILHKVDIASMAHSLECRQPFMDHRIVELAAAMPVEQKFRHGIGKCILRRAFSTLLPDEVWTRPKMGFGVPLDHWFRDELREMSHDVLLDSKAEARGLFQPNAVRRMLEEHQNRTSDHAYRLWSLLILELWMREWLDG